jgi:hypothetical protein
VTRAVLVELGRRAHRARRRARRACTQPRSGWQQLFRHSYCAARLQTLDAGARVSIYTVARELGHQSDEMVKCIYAHLGAARHRSGQAEYRLEQHVDQLGDRVRRLGIARQCREENPPPRPKSKRGIMFRSGPGATRTRDLLLRRGIPPLRSADRRWV